MKVRRKMVRRKIEHRRRYKLYPPNVPKKLFQLYRSLGYSITKLAERLEINSGHISKLFNDGIEPSDKTMVGQQIRRKLFLSRKKRKTKDKNVSYDTKKQPEHIKKWRHLPTAERNEVIKQYLDWLEHNKGE